jgi:hypothetical protein
MESRAFLPQTRRLGLRKWAPPRPQALLGQAILRKYIRPLAQELGIEKRIGWHTFRHTYSTLLRRVGTEFKVMQELLRHSSLRSTLDVYTQAITPAKHAAQAAVMSLVFSEGRFGDALSDQRQMRCEPRIRPNRFREKGGAKGAPNVSFLHPFLIPPTPTMLFRMNGGDDGARTRDLCRDSRLGTRNFKKLNATDGYFWRY